MALILFAKYGVYLAYNTLMTQADLIFHKPITLIGMMGAGKTRLGHALAETLHIPFHDSDHHIVEEAGCTIPEIFDHLGEEAFRDLEERTIARLVSSGVSVISTGGGCIKREATRTLLHTKALCVWLQADVPVLVNRIASCPQRPLLHSSLDPHARLATLLEERKNLYAQAAHIQFRTDEAPAEETEHSLLKAVTNYAHS